MQKIARDYSYTCRWLSWQFDSFIWNSCFISKTTLIAAFKTEQRTKHWKQPDSIIFENVRRRRICYDGAGLWHRQWRQLQVQHLRHWPRGTFPPMFTRLNKCCNPILICYQPRNSTDLLCTAYLRDVLCKTGLTSAQRSYMFSKLTLAFGSLGLLQRIIITKLVKIQYRYV